MLFTELLPITALKDRVLLNVKVTPKASKDRVGEILNNALKIYTKEVAEDGKANKAVINILADRLDIKKSDISIEKGFTSQNKLICIYGNPDEIIKRLKTMQS